MKAKDLLIMYKLNPERINFLLNYMLSYYIKEEEYEICTTIHRILENPSSLDKYTALTKFWRNDFSGVAWSLYDNQEPIELFGKTQSIGDTVLSKIDYLFIPSGIAPTTSNIFASFTGGTWYTFEA